MLKYISEILEASVFMILYSLDYFYIQLLQWNNYSSFFFQYGFVNYALELLVLRNFGEEAWEKIK